MVVIEQTVACMRFREHGEVIYLTFFTFPLERHQGVDHQRANSQRFITMLPLPPYDAEAPRQLSDGRFYEQLCHDPVKEYQQVLKTAVKQMIQANAPPASAKNLILQTPRTSRLYLLPKIHKENNPGRPIIVSACNCPTENIASYLDMVMSPLMCNLKTYVKDTNHSLQIFRTFQFAHNDARQHFLYTMDIKSLYTVILTTAV